MSSDWIRRALFGGFVLMVASATVVSVARADGGFFTTYTSRVERGEVELMLMNDFTSPSESRRAEGQREYFSHMLELEYGITDQLATELMIESFEEPATGEARLTGFRWELRYRLFRHQVPLNPMLYVEYEDLDPATRFKMEVSGWVRPPYTESGPEPTRERVLESRLVLSQSIGPLDLATNFIAETDLHSGLTAFGYAVGLMWMPSMRGGGDEQEDEAEEHGLAYSCPMHPAEVSDHPGRCPRCGMALARPPANTRGTAMGVGLEMYGALGDTRAFGIAASRQEHYFGPILMYHPAPRWMIHTQLAIGLTSASDALIRLNVGYEL